MTCLPTQCSTIVDCTQRVLRDRSLSPATEADPQSVMIITRQGALYWAPDSKRNLHGAGYWKLCRDGNGPSSGGWNFSQQPPGPQAGAGAGSDKLPPAGVWSNQRKIPQESGSVEYGFAC